MIAARAPASSPSAAAAATATTEATATSQGDTHDTTLDYDDNDQDDSMSEIREALDHAFTTLPTPPATSPSSSLNGCSSGDGAGTSEPLETPDAKRTLLTADSLSSAATAPKKRNSSATASIISNTSSGVRHHHHGPAPTRPPQYPLPPPPSSPSKASPVLRRPTLSATKGDRSLTHSHDSGVAMQSTTRDTASDKVVNRHSDDEAVSPTSPIAAIVDQLSAATSTAKTSATALSHSKRPSLSSILSTATSTAGSGVADDNGSRAEKRIWRISSTGQHYLDDDFTAAFGSPSLGQLAGQFGVATSMSHTVHENDQDNNSGRGYGAPSEPNTASPHSGRSGSMTQFPAFQHRGPLLLSEATSPVKSNNDVRESASNQQLQRSNNASATGRFPSLQGLPYVNKPIVQQPYNERDATNNSATNASAAAAATAAALREQKLAHLRARQQELLREQREIEALEREAQEAAAAEARSAAARAAAEANTTEDTDMHDRSDDQEEHLHRDSSSTSPPTKRIARAGRTTSAAAALDELATEFEVASLRAQVTQLQLALKKQMATSSSSDGRRPRNISGSGGNSPHHVRMGELTAEFMGVPTPEESFAGSSVRLSTDGGSFARSPLQQQRRGSTFDDVGSVGSLQRSGRGTSRRPRTATDEYTSPQAMAAARMHFPSNSGSVMSSSRPSHVSSRMDDSASAMVRPGDDRVDELSQKLDRLEELFRLTALQQQNAGHDNMGASSPVNGASGTSQRDARHHDTGSVSTITQNHQYQHQQHQHQHMPAMSFPEGFSPAHHSQPYEQQAGQHGPVRTSSLSSVSSSYAHSFSSMRNHSPTALSAFNYNATTPFGARYSPESQVRTYQSHQQEPHAPLHSLHRGHAFVDGSNSLNVPVQQGGGLQHHALDASPSSSVSSGLSAHAAAVSGSGSAGSTRTTKVELVRRKGVARFILGSSTTRLIDAQGGTVVPSIPVSMSRSRTDRVEKLPAKVKVKQGAGRGRVTVVQKKVEPKEATDSAAQIKDK